ncbi:hybrid sensor histidine kinase/response regulator transcription factor [Mucilaginibacter phyllosphaerae]|uniref:histidine kinase n=1 Tax=Mucilaginibacter phyllosphaerae TaxID=1812349 RepID=A0A4Y8AI31_9SPHI|nr:two-component regulator propeller domain-containing protein [Mucilaginibacter phyllosphaerae]MBB3968263.1 ligand-binding sensor domain-containing protein/signal transduction histidine kinase/CheY-like chemotaxis protein/AraC-like DNA-binding protein [Mucilaginibacter phyllosphaerae]TEW68730.1 hybrid sensor histidine kinase/response regulator [Mucilaginibacter phyllosphaerae]GGH00110.1 hybrid sensor histidine kinase/response regulator [Mucilaginibacter phyllosphaerae]
MLLIIIAKSNSADAKDKGKLFFSRLIYNGKYFFTVFLALLFILPLHAQNVPLANSFYKDFSLVTYTINDGLPSRNTTTAIKDKYGFMWIGTENGLCKFDGYNFKTFQNNQLDSNSISNNFINAIVADKNGRLWIGTMDGLNLFDPLTEKFTRYFHKDNQKASLSHDKIWALLTDVHGTLWIGTDDGFNKYNSKKNNFEVYKPDARNAYAMKGKSVNAIVEDGGNLWLGNWGSGLNKFNIATSRFTNYRQVQQPGQKNANDVWALCKDEEGIVWVGTYWKGLYKFDPKTETFTSFNRPDINNKAVFNLLTAGNHTLLVGSDENFYWVNTQTNTWTPLDDFKNNPNGNIYKDAEGVLWICARDGVAKLDFNQIKFSFFKFTGLKPEVRSIITKNDIAWLGTNKGLIRYNLKTHSSIIYRHTNNIKSLGNDDISRLYQDSKGKIWITTEFGFDEFDEANNVFNHHYHHSSLGALYNEDVFRDILEISPGIYGLATDAGLKIFNSKLNTYTHYFSSGSKNSISNNHLNCLLKDTDNTIWIGTSGGGLNRFYPETGRFKSYLLKGGAQKGISNNTIKKIFIDSRKNIWICTPDGLNLYDRKSDSFVIYSEANGFNDNVFNDMVEDKAGNLWVITEKGMSVLNPRTGDVKNFDEADGLYSNSAIYNYQDKIYVAGSRGIVLFNPVSINYNKQIPPVAFTNFQIFNKPITPSAQGPLKENLNTAKRITLNYNQNVFSLEFVALNYTLSAKNEYAYMLQGFDKKWNYVGRQRKATYTNLDPGTYVFNVKAANNDGVWNNVGKSLIIVITPPWYLTWWAYTAYFLIICTLVYSYILYNERQAKLRYEIRLAHLEGEKEKELHQKKLSFFTNISHEFRTPLTLIINPVKELLSAQNLNDNTSLNIVYRNAKRLLSLVDQLLLFHKADSSTGNLKISKLNIAYLANEVYLCFIHQAKARQINFEIICEEKFIELYADKEKIEIVLFNLLSNAIKFTPFGGIIKMTVYQDLSSVTITVQDTGCGIKEGTGDRLYTRFFQEESINNSSKGGFGIGLFLVKHFVEDHLGSISYTSKYGQGTLFKVSLLKGVRHFNPQIVYEDTEAGSVLLHELIEEADNDVYMEDVLETAPGEEELQSGLKSILLIDDNRDFREYLKMIFKTGYNVHEAGSAEEGLQKIKELLPDIVVSDVVMENMNGIDLCAIVKADINIGHTPIILLTSSSSTEGKLKGLEGGADDYISKPFDIEILKARVTGILKSKNNLQQYFYNEITLNKNTHKIPLEYKEFLDSCMRIVEQHLTDPDFSIQILANELSISHSSLYKKIKLISGLSANGFIRFIRLRKAAEILINTNHNIFETSYLVGINDIKYFREQFKKLFNMNPSQYMKKYRKVFSTGAVNTINRQPAKP